LRAKTSSTLSPFAATASFCQEEEEEEETSITTRGEEAREKERRSRRQKAVSFMVNLDESERWAVDGDFS